jgi:hypothetical protein
MGSGELPSCTYQQIDGGEKLGSSGDRSLEHQCDRLLELALKNSSFK